ncbi:hypothetical protein CEXT_81331 [Caerostris extrusa]|uniref:Uncharacterized protein n=1 Tax=Caerostris extrusa TaxID=172846 RepID=A0AAV4P9M5_CAEEX|nr:hypothetical protein CEXT_81331 [Caerostris extrusa]
MSMTIKQSHLAPEVKGPSIIAALQNQQLQTLVATSSPPPEPFEECCTKSVLTPFHFLTDIDILPVAGLARQLDVFLSTSYRGKSCSKCAYVVPTYEMPEQLPVPRNK